MKYFFLIVFSYVSVASFSQKKITTDELLFGRNVSEIDTSDVENQIASLGQLSIVDKWEFRTETDEWDFNRQQYTLRASFNDFNSKNIYNDINSINKESFLLLDKQYFENRIYQKYKNIIDLHYLERKQVLADSMLIILNDQKKIIEFEIANGSSVSINNLVKIDFAIRELNIDKNSYVFKKNLIVEKIDSTLKNDEFIIDTLGWISNTTIIKNLGDESANVNSEINLKSQKLKYSDIELKRQDSEAKRVLDFVQLQYAGRNNLTPLNEFSIGFGINIPTKSSNIRKRSEALVDKLEDELELKQVKTKVHQDLEDLVFKIQMKNLEYTSYVKYMDEIKASTNSNVFESLGDPKAVLEYRLNNLKIEKDLIGIKYEMLEDYLELLLIKGWLLNYPNVNFLSNNFDLK